MSERGGFFWGGDKFLEKKIFFKFLKINDILFHINKSVLKKILNLQVCTENAYF